MSWRDGILTSHWRVVFHKSHPSIRFAEDLITPPWSGAERASVDHRGIFCRTLQKASTQCHSLGDSERSTYRRHLLNPATMICRQCLHIASRGTSLNTSSSLNTIGRRQFSTSPSSFLSNTASSYGRAAVTPKQRVPKTAATSTETADSDPAATISEVSKKKAGRGTPANAPISISSVPAGTPLKGLNFMKSGSDPVALEDHEYPSWLWDILKKEEKKADEGLEGDLFGKFPRIHLP